MATHFSILTWKILWTEEPGGLQPMGLQRVPQHNQATKHQQQPRKRLLLLLLSHFSHVRLCATPWTAAYQASPSMGFSRQEHWSGLPLPSPMHESGK